MNRVNIALFVAFLFGEIGGLYVGGGNGAAIMLAGIVVPLLAKGIQKFLDKETPQATIIELPEHEAPQHAEIPLDHLFDNNTNHLGEKFTLSELRRALPTITDPKVLTHISIRVPQVVSPEMSILIRNDLNKFSEILTTGRTVHMKPKTRRAKKRASRH